MLKNIVWFIAGGALLLLAFIPSYLKIQDLQGKNDAYAKAIVNLQRHNAKLELEKHLLETDPVYLEKVAREKMGLIRDGEKVYRIVPSQKPAAQ